MPGDDGLNGAGSSGFGCAMALASHLAPSPFRRSDGWVTFVAARRAASRRPVGGLFTPAGSGRAGLGAGRVSRPAWRAHAFECSRDQAGVGGRWPA